MISEEIGLNASLEADGLDVAETDLGEYLIQIRGETPCLLTIAQAHYHRWRADVDGRPVKVWRANYAFQALEVPAGQHLVRLKYEDRLFQAGSLISILSIVGCLLWVRRSVNAPPSRGVL